MTSPDTTAPPHLLIVDDSPATIKLLLGLFEHDYDVHFATSGREALARIEQGYRPDLILLDVMMPEMDGYAVCAALKQDPGTRAIPVIFITARTDPGSERQALASGAVDFIAKPFDREVVRARVQLHLELKRHRHQLEHLVAVRTRELAAACDAAERANRAKTAFLASASHELRTPLTPILGLTEALRCQVYGPLPDSALPGLAMIEENGRKLLALIDRILDLTRLESGAIELQFAPCVVADIGQASLYQVKRLAEQKRQSLAFALEPPDLMMRADGQRLRQVLVHLLDNAVKFTPEGGRIGLQITGDREAGEVRLTVWDSGIGIAPADLPNLFQPFVQLDDRLARQYEGVGLGLVLVKRLTELHGGRVTVESTPGQGSRFTLTLPWEPVASAA